LRFWFVRHNAAETNPQLPPLVTISLTAVVALWLDGCSIALPSATSPELWGGGKDDVTSAIPAFRAPLSHALDQEDWRRASAAMGTALDPQGDGSTVNWDNPNTSAKGSFTPVGQPYPRDGKICRAFVAEIGAKDTHESLQGTACREKAAEWALSEVKPWKKG
jgi:surface antigen